MAKPKKTQEGTQKPAFWNKQNRSREEERFEQDGVKFNQVTYFILELVQFNNEKSITNPW